MKIVAILLLLVFLTAIGAIALLWSGRLDVSAVCERGIDDTPACEPHPGAQINVVVVSRREELVE